MGLVYGQLTGQSGSPIAGVRLRFWKNGVLTYQPLTDANGNYCISSAAIGTYTVTATKYDHVCVPSSVNVPAGSLMVSFIDTEMLAQASDTEEPPDGTVEAPLRVFWYYPDPANPPKDNKIPNAIKIPKGTYACAVQTPEWEWRVKSYLDDQVEKEQVEADRVLVVWNLKNETDAPDLSGDGWICANKKGKSAPKKPAPKAAATKKPAAKKAAPKKAAAKKK